MSNPQPYWSDKESLGDQRKKIDEESADCEKQSVDN
jgi:hypothetical protein